jgi:hypothetical protein
MGQRRLKVDELPLDHPITPVLNTIDGVRGQLGVVEIVGIIF